MHHVFSGTGPGAQAPDGCSVELYRNLPYLGDLDPVRELLPPLSSVLELGCGTGRLTRKLLEWELRPTSVDNSAQMLAALPSAASPVLSEIERVDLSKKVDVVLLAINHYSRDTHASFVAAAARHLNPGANMLVQRHDPSWLESAQVGFVGTIGPASIHLESVERSGRVVRMTLRYAIGEAAMVS